MRNPGGDPGSLTMYMTGGPVAVPATISGVRDALPETERARFTDEIESIPADGLQMALMRWAMLIPTEQDAAEEELAARLIAGDFSGVTYTDDLGDDEYRGAP
ncbi:hypothetical protein AB0G74_33410 [Streptomyces sp. NPDC020875]|uniref:hypothetical protein n=1 Tax=Streptomyces sp. NPDC020875 TaxID=3154898 RepID=UPI0033EE8A43